MPRDVHNIKSQIVMDKDYKDVIKNLRGIKLPSTPIFTTGVISIDPVGPGKVNQIENQVVFNLDSKHGSDVIRESKYAIAAYDESIAAYEALEGKAVSVSHALVYLCSDRYLPVTYVTLRFFTHSQKIGNEMGEAAVVTDNVDRQSKICTALDKMKFLDTYCEDDCILLIDGPLIAGDDYTTFMKQIDKFIEHGILSAFFIKNSNSNMVIDNVPEYSHDYNSDMHWADSILKPGQRTCFFEYTDLINSDNSKVFCYIKFYENTSPVRLEFPTKVYENFNPTISDILDLVYYLLLVQGDKRNPQVRPIAIAEKYARETLNVIDVLKEIRKAGLTATMNENRWGH